MKRFLCLLSVLLIILMIPACSTSKDDSYEKIAGRWEHIEESGYAGYDNNLEFFNDGTYVYEGRNLSYSITDDRLKLVGEYSYEVKVFTFEITKDRLTFYNDDGEIATAFMKIK